MLPERWLSVSKINPTLIARRLAAMQADMPPMPTDKDIFAQLVRLEKLWTAAEYRYIQHFHKVYGFEERSDWFRGDHAYDEWQYWHLLAIQRYKMTEYRLSEHLAALPSMRPKPWKFEDTSFQAESKARPHKGHVCISWDNVVPYDLDCLRARGWQFVDFLLPGPDILMRRDAIWPFTIYALLLKEPDVTLLFSSPGAFETLTYFLENRAKLIKQYKIKRIDAPLDYKVYTPDAGYSYDWQTGKLLDTGYIADFNKREKQLAEQEQRQPDDEIQE